MIRTLALASLAATALAGPAAAAPAAHQCFFANQLSSWTAAGDSTVNLRVGVNDFYQLQLLGPCPDLKWAESIGIKTRGGSDNICSGLDVELIVPSTVTHTVPQRCMATSLRKLSPDEAAALPRKQKP